MIIKKTKASNIENKDTKASKQLKAPSAKKNVIKKEDLILDSERAENTSEINGLPPTQELPKAESETKEAEKPKPQELEEFEKIDISSIEFKERVERRRGDRRRGYRRIDERSLVTRAQQEAHSIKELAAREGYENGLKKATSELEEIKNDLAEFLSAKDEMYDNFYPHLLEMSLEIAKKIINKEVEMSNDVLKNIIMSTLDEINTDVQRVTIKVNSADAEFAAASLPEIIEAKKLDIKVSIASDDTIEKGSCIVVANNGVIDANFKTQLTVLQNAFGIYKGGI